MKAEDRIELRRLILGAVFSDPSILDAPWFGDDLWDDCERRIVAAMRAVRANGSLDVTLVRVELGETDTSGQWTAELMAILERYAMRGSQFAAPHLAERLRAAARKARIAATARAAAVAVEEGEEDGTVRELLESARDTLSQTSKESPVSLIDIPSILETEDPPIPWVINGLLASQDLAIVAGEPGTGKSILALEMALAMASGGQFLGMTCEPQKVLYCDEEMSRLLAQRRLKLLIRGRGVDPATLKLTYMNGNGIKLDTEAGMAQLSKEIERTSAQWVILDSLIRFHDLDENSNSEMSSVIGTLRMLQERYGCGFIILHHLSKPGKDKSQELGHRLRGASDLRAAVDQLYGLEGNPATNTRVLTHNKCRWSECQAPKTMRYDEKDGKATLTVESAFGNSETITVELITEAAEQGISRRDIVSVLASSYRAPERITSRTISALLKSGIIRKSSSKPGAKGLFWLTSLAPQSSIGFSPEDDPNDDQNEDRH